ncbi:MAG: Nif3-like dinuclear metal center hexameric protein [Thiomicrospira sp.]|uniref:Nif3-like dinuclear metal center hexameric protein n=1 Tax=Thiomicrospira sp. TaxID=935 RepID=UPI0019EA6FB3|nr:Nif3-like dinuclear metal center hexameric protein [Thiomicrospira sp.]MBE0493567.1 Nif3-like dinuclear metal center hexameric protein [Thiomicrospira sp.]
MLRDELVAHLHQLLEVDQYQDYAPNGLQVEGAEQIKRMVLGVTANQALIDAAIECQADTILVHHGYFWKSEAQTITGMKYQRIKKLIQNNINLLAYHLPLDGHAKYGNNAQLGKLWQLDDMTPVPGLVRLGRLAKPISMDQFKRRVAESLGREPLHLPGGPELVQTIAWCSGGAQGYIQQALDWQADVYISGEVSEQTTHVAKESGIHYLAAGHHATETWGVKSLAEYIQNQFGIECRFVDCANPV